jgi:hypothetical protein
MSLDRPMKPLACIIYAREDEKAAQRLYNDLKEAGLNPWLDKESLLHGQNWETEIRNAIKNSRYLIILLSSASVRKRGYVQNEFKLALDVLDEFPESNVFAIPVRLDDCDIPEKLQGIEFANLFPNWKEGLRMILDAMMSVKAINLQLSKKDIVSRSAEATTHDNVDSFCSDCGQQVTTRTQRFCPNCGYDLKRIGAVGDSISSSNTDGDVFGVGVRGSGDAIGKGIVISRASIPPKPKGKRRSVRRLVGRKSGRKTAKKGTKSKSFKRHPPVWSRSFSLNSEIRTTVEKYPYATFPEKIAIGEIAPLKVLIKAVMPTPIKSTSMAQGIGAVKITVSKEEEEKIPVQVYIEQDNFEVVGGKYWNTIHIPIANNEDSNPIIFDLKAKREGKQDITIQFFQQGIYIGQIKVNTVVLHKVPVHNNTLSSSEQQTQIIWDISKLPPRPDIMLYIYEKKRYPEYEYEIWLNSAEYDNYPIGSKILTREAESRIHAIFNDIENMNLPADIFDSKMRAKGRSLYKELFSEELKKFYWLNRDRIKSFQIITKDPWIPWEIIKPWDQDMGKEDPFLCERYAFSRWIVGKKIIIPNEQLKKVLVVVPSTTDLTNSLAERDWIGEFVKSIGAEVSTDSKYRHVVSALEKGEYDILHFSTHGKYNKDHPLFSQIDLEDGLSLRPEDVGEMAIEFRQSKPIVILNTCQSGVQGFSLTEIKSWATQFLDAGASAFIGTLWRVSDEAALKFTKELYKQLANGITLGEAVQKARTICKEPGDSSWLAYELYGQPNSYLKFGVL